MKEYIITDRAGPYVAGIRVAGLAPSLDGKTRIKLSDEQAAFELNAGSIELDTKGKPSAVKTVGAAEPDAKA